MQSKAPSTGLVAFAIVFGMSHAIASGLAAVNTPDGGHWSYVDHDLAGTHDWQAIWASKEGPRDYEALNTHRAAALTEGEIIRCTSDALVLALHEEDGHTPSVRQIANTDDEPGANTWGLDQAGREHGVTHNDNVRGVLIAAIVFAIFVGTFICTLLYLGGISDHFDPRQTLLFALTIQAVGVIVFAFESRFWT